MLSANELFSVLNGLPLGFLLLLPDAPKFTVVLANDCFPGGNLSASPKSGMGLFDVLPGGQRTGLRRVLRHSLDCMIRGGRPHSCCVPGYRSGDEGEDSEWWNVEHIPVRNEAGEIGFILHVPSCAGMGGEMDEVAGGMSGEGIGGEVGWAPVGEAGGQVCGAPEGETDGVPGGVGDRGQSGYDRELLEDLKRMNSHDIRRPLANILGTLDLISVCRRDGERVPQEYLDFLYVSANQIDGVVRRVVEVLSSKL